MEIKQDTFLISLNLKSALTNPDIVNTLIANESKKEL